MPLLVYHNNMWFKSGSGALVVESQAGEVSADIKGDKRLGASVTAGELAPYLKGTMGRKQTLSVQSIGEVVLALPKKIATIACSVSIGAIPSAFDVAQAVWGSIASQVNNAGTMGQRLNSAGDPWTTDLSAYNTAGTAGKELKDKLSQDDFLALK